MSFRYAAGINKPGFDPLTNGQGIWNLSSQANAKAAGTWPRAPGAPTIGTATGGDASASITFTAPSDLGVPAATSYTMTSSPGSLTGTGATSPITVSGLTNGTPYTFTVKAVSTIGAGADSAASNSVTPVALLYLWSWGRSNFGQLGLGNTTDYSSPKQVGALNTWASIEAGQQSNQRAGYAIKTNGTLWSWGKNDYGQLGLGNTTNYSSPKQIGALTSWLKISGGSYGSVSAIKTDGTLWSWGYNGNGQLGLGNTTNYSSPKQVGALTSWSIVSSSYGTLAIKTNGTLWSWGRNSQGQLGLGNTTYYSSPKQVGSLTSWASVSANHYGSFAIKTDGTLWSWGENAEGQLGLGNTTQYSSPKQVGALTSWSKVFYGEGNQTISVKTNGTLWSWGSNNVGQLGLSNTTSYSSPKQVGALTDWSTPTAGANTSGCLKTDGTIWMWGDNQYGQLGVGSTVNKSSPVQVGAATVWTSISTSQFFTLGLRAV